MPPPKIKEWIEKNYKPAEPENPMLKVPLHFTAEEDGSSVSLVCWDDYDEYDFIDSWCKLDYSMDGKSWQTYIDPDSDNEELHRGKDIKLNKGETVYFKATLGDVDENPNMDGFSRNGNSIYHYFDMKGSIKADGNIQFLLENTGTEMKVPDYCYTHMFQGRTSLTQAPVLPATTLAKKCYERMFSGCTNLTKAPALPATTLMDECYYDMFSDCTALTQAPELPAETLAKYCYGHMFYGCTALTQAPELPAETLAEVCYAGMFYRCTNLTQAPALPATTLAKGCYTDMFYNCSSLTQAPELPATTLMDEGYYNMFCYCTSLTKAPELPATTLAYGCYSNMFKGCSNLTQAPVLPATTLAYSCYERMFEGCTSIPEPKYDMSYMTFDGVANAIKNTLIFGDGGTYEVQCSDKILVATYNADNWEWTVT